MTASPATTAARPAEPGRGAAKILLVVLGSLGALVAMALVVAGIVLVVAHTQRDADGFLSTPTERFASGSYALTHEGVEVGDATSTPSWVVDRIGTIRVRATSGNDRPLFVGIGPAAAVSRYLAGVAHDEVTHLDYDPFVITKRRSSGAASPATPSQQSFWVASASGRDTQTVEWKVDDGRWSLVVMNADASRSVAADVQFAAKVGWLLWVGLALGAVGLLIGAGSAAMIVYGAGGGGGGSGAVAGGGGVAVPLEAGPVEETYPVAVEARLDEPLSRWRWLVKWFLAIPHFVVLVFLWVAFTLLSLFAFFAILFTGRYPRPVFDFNVGVMRWTWRVSFYATSALGTDRYPPFSLGHEPDYPATLEVAYPERLSRGLVLVKSWLLAIPHLIVVGLFTGSATWSWSGRFVDWPGLIEILTVVAGVILLFRNRYPRDVFDLVVGLNRWVWRVVAYVALMRDEYPPFRLGR